MIEHIITASVLIIAILLLSQLLEKRIDPRVKYVLWLLVVIKLLIPIPEFESKISIMNLISIGEADFVAHEEAFYEDAVEAEVSGQMSGQVSGQISDQASGLASGQIPSEQKMTGQIPAEQTVLSSDVSAQNGQMQSGQAISGQETQGDVAVNNNSSTKAPMIHWGTICRIIWLIGAAICTSVFVWSNFRFTKNLHGNRKRVGKVKEKFWVYETSQVETPCLFGFPRPAIYLQEGMILSKEQRKHILLHEYTHYKHGDHVWAVVRCVCLILYWYNPLVWLAARASIKDSELACDAGVMKVLREESHVEYGKTLIEVAKGASNKAPTIQALVCSTSATGGMLEMKKRIQMIAKRPHTKFTTIMVLMVVCVCLVGCTFGNAVSEEGLNSEADANPEAGTNQPEISQSEVLQEDGSPESGTQGNETNSSRTELTAEQEADMKRERMEIAKTMIEQYIAETEAKVEVLEATALSSVTPVDLNVLAGDIYVAWNNTLNTSLEVIKASLDEALMEQLLAEQRQWEATRDTAVKAASEETGEEPSEGGGSGSEASVAGNQKAAELTKERVYELAEYCGNVYGLSSSQPMQEVTFDESIEGITVNGVTLQSQPEADKVYIYVQPEGHFGYYIPQDKDQTWLLERVKSLNLEGQPYDRRWEGKQECGWQLVYNDTRLMAFQGGYLYCQYADDEGIKEIFIEDPKLCDYIQIMLQEEFDYRVVDVTDIKDIVSAKLDVNAPFTNFEAHSQTITDEEILKKFEEWFCNADYIFGGEGCPFSDACLELTLKSGEVVKLFMATDSCPNFCVNGVCYDYRPTTDWDNAEFFKCFDEIPYYE